MTKSQRKQVEDLIYSYFNKLDKSGINTSYYQEIFSKLDDKAFLKFMEKPLCIRFQHKPFENEPTMTDILESLDVIKVPLLERVSFSSIYVNEDGIPVETPPCFVGYIHGKKMKQFLTKKNSMSTNIDTRDHKTGLLISEDKNGKTSDREIEGMTLMGLDKTCREMTTWKADFMDSKSKAYQTISLTGQISENDLNINSYESLSRNMLNCYLISAGIYTNFLNEDYMLPSTIMNKSKKIERK